MCNGHSLLRSCIVDHLEEGHSEFRLYVDDYCIKFGSFGCRDMDRLADGRAIDHGDQDPRLGHRRCDWRDHRFDARCRGPFRLGGSHIRLFLASWSGICDGENADRDRKAREDAEQRERTSRGPVESRR